MQITEAKKQEAFVKWFRLNYPDLTLFHIPNGENRNKLVALKLKRMGVLSGVFDLFLIDTHTFIEFKRSKSCKLSPNQVLFKAKAEETGYTTFTFWSVSDAVEQISRLIYEQLKLKPNIQA